MPRGRLSELSKFATLDETRRMIANGQLQCGANVLQYKYRTKGSDHIYCFGDVVSKIGLILSRGLVQKPGETKPQIDKGFLESLTASTSPVYTMVSPGVFLFGSFSKFATAYCRYFSGKPRRENGKSKVTQYGLPINDLLKGTPVQGCVPITRAYSTSNAVVAAVSLPLELTLEANIAKKNRKTNVKRKTREKQEETEIRTKHKEQTYQYKIDPDSEMKAAKNALKQCYKNIDIETWTTRQIMHATSEIIRCTQTWQKVLIDLYNDLGVQRYEDVSQGKKRKCMEEGLKNGFILAEPKKKQRLDMRARAIHMQLNSLVKGKFTMSVGPRKHYKFGGKHETEQITPIHDNSNGCDASESEIHNNACQELGGKLEAEEIIPGDCDSSVSQICGSDLHNDAVTLLNNNEQWSELVYVSDSELPLVSSQDAEDQVLGLH